MARQTLDHPANHDAGHETVHHGPADSAAQPAAAKVCRMCGQDVSGQRRYKDAAGRYYCEPCFTAQINDTSDDVASAQNPTPPPMTRSTPPPVEKKRLAHCPDCKGEFAPEALIDFGGVKLCEKCLHQREQSAKRQAARLAAAEEESRAAEQRRRTITRIVVIVVAVLGMYLVLRVLMT